VRVGGVGLAALPGIKHAGPGGQLGGHVQHPLPAGQQPLRNRAADPVGPFDGPDPFRPLLGELQQLPVAARIGAELAGGPQDLPSSRVSIVTDSLCGSTPMITLSIKAPPRPWNEPPARTGNAIPG
jgi:hypothetical protein